METAAGIVNPKKTKEGTLGKSKFKRYTILTQSTQSHTLLIR